MLRTPFAFRPYPGGYGGGRFDTSSCDEKSQEVPIKSGLLAIQRDEKLFDAIRRETEFTCSLVTIPVVAWSTPVTLLGARLQFLVATPALLVAVEHTDSFSGMYNPLVSGQLAWDLGNGWGFSYLFGAYLDVHSDVAWSSTSINQRFALSYTNDGWNLTANVI